MSKKNLALIVVALVLIIILGAKMIMNKNSKSENSQDISEPTTKVATVKENGTFKIYNTNISTDTGSTKIKATVKNISNSTTEEQKIEIQLVDKDENEVGVITTVIPKLESGKSTIISAESLKVYENIYDFKIKN